MGMRRRTFYEVTRYGTNLWWCYHTNSWRPDAPNNPTAYPQGCSNHSKKFRTKKQAMNNLILLNSLVPPGTELELLRFHFTGGRRRITGYRFLSQ